MASAKDSIKEMGQKEETIIKMGGERHAFLTRAAS